jgi:hypothetical protein
MCMTCQSTEGWCFCGTNKDPQSRTAQCGARGSDGYCSVCGHAAGAVPADTSQMEYDYQEY